MSLSIELNLRGCKNISYENLSDW